MALECVRCGVKTRWELGDSRLVSFGQVAGIEIFERFPLFQFLNVAGAD